MASRFPLELELTVSSAKDLKNVNWRYGDLEPYVVAWVDPDSKLTTKVDDQNDTCPVWNEKLTIPVRAPCLEDAVLSIDVVHTNASGETKPLIGSARLHLKEVVDEVGFNERYTKSLKLKRPSGRPQGKLEVKVTVYEIRYPAPSPYPHPQPYGQTTSRDYQPTHPYTGYGAPPPPYGAPPAGYPGAYGSGYGYNAPQQQYYGGYDSGYGNGAAAPVPATSAPPAKKGGKYGGVGTGLAVGAVAGVLGGLALAGGANYVEDKIADKVSDRVGDDFGGDYDDDY
ncbi:protein SRC2-like [Nymphaea colorata]|nr:protein SRC2-like [Nymphaea colorata]